MVTGFDKKICKSIAMEMEKALAEIGKKHGLSIQYRGGRFDTTKFVPKIEIKVKQTASGMSADEAEWQHYALNYGFKARDFGKTFRYGGEIYSITGVAPRRRSKPILVTRRDDGQQYRFPSSTVLNLIGK